jgi:hypothetical protein
LCVEVDDEEAADTMVILTLLVTVDGFSGINADDGFVKKFNLGTSVRFDEG